MTAPSEAEALVERLSGIAAQIAVARQVGEDGYWTMKVSDGAYLLDLIASLRTEVERLQERRNDEIVKAASELFGHEKRVLLREVERLQEQVREAHAVIAKYVGVYGDDNELTPSRAQRLNDDEELDLLRSRLDLAMRVVEAAREMLAINMRVIPASGGVPVVHLSEPVDVARARRLQALADSVAALDAGTTPPTDPDCGGRCDCHDTDGVMFCSTCCREYQVQPAGTTPE